MEDLHTGLKTSVVGEAAAPSAGVEFRLLHQVQGKNRQTHSLHALPTTLRFSGAQTSDLLTRLGLEHQSHCSLFNDRPCFAKAVAEGFDAKAFAVTFEQMFRLLEAATRKLENCGFRLPDARGNVLTPGGGRRGLRTAGATGDAHQVPSREELKRASDDYFNYAFTFIKGGADMGWVTHYRPKHGPLTPEMQAALDFLQLRRIEECPELDFEECAWRFTPYQEERGGLARFESAGVAHGWFDAHPTAFAEGLKDLMELQALAVRFGMHLWTPARPAPATSAVAPARPASLSGSRPPPPAGALRATPSGVPGAYEFDVALSFAGPQRPVAVELATALRDAGIRVFYDDFYAERLWGKDLTLELENIYQRGSRYCVIFVSQEYASRMWTSHEFQNARARAVEQVGREYILPVRLEPVELPGLPHTISYLELARVPVPKLAEMLIQKVRGSA